MFHIGDEFTEESAHASEEFKITNIEGHIITARSIYGEYEKKFTIGELENGTKDTFYHFNRRYEPLNDKEDFYTRKPPRRKHHTKSREKTGSRDGRRISIVINER